MVRPSSGSGAGAGVRVDPKRKKKKPPLHRHHRCHSAEFIDCLQQAGLQQEPLSTKNDNGHSEHSRYTGNCTGANAGVVHRFQSSPLVIQDRLTSSMSSVSEKGALLERHLTEPIHSSKQYGAMNMKYYDLGLVDEPVQSALLSKQYLSRDFGDKFAKPVVSSQVKLVNCKRIFGFNFDVKYEVNMLLLRNTHLKNRSRK